MYEQQKHIFMIIYNIILCRSIHVFDKSSMVFCTQLLFLFLPFPLTPWGISVWWTKIHPSHCCHYIYSKMSGTVAVRGLETISGWMESRTFCPHWKQSLSASSSACPCQGLQPPFLCCDYFSIDLFHRY